MRFWTTDYQEFEWKIVSGHGGSEELYQVGLRALVQALVKAVYDDQSWKFAREEVTLVCQESEGFEDKLFELHLNGICKDERISLNSEVDDLVGAGDNASNAVGDIGDQWFDCIAFWV